MIHSASPSEPTISSRKSMKYNKAKKINRKSKTATLKCRKRVELAVGFVPENSKKSEFPNRSWWYFYFRHEIDAHVSVIFFLFFSEFYIRRSQKTDLYIWHSHTIDQLREISFHDWSVETVGREIQRVNPTFLVGVSLNPKNNKSYRVKRTILTRAIATICKFRVPFSGLFFTFQLS